MKTIHFCMIALLLGSLVFTAAGQNQHSLAVLPFIRIGVDSATALSVETLLRLEIEQDPSERLISAALIHETLQDTVCEEVPCAIEIGRRLAADQVLITRLLRLGEKVVINFQLIDVEKQTVLLNEKTTAAFAEDLDTVASRMAKSIVQRISIAKTVAVGAITAEEAKDPLRRGAHSFAAFSFGYLYPNHGYDEADRSFCFDFRTGAEFARYDIGLQLALRKGFAVNLFFDALMTKTDLCPYFGAGFGFHWVSHNPSYYIAPQDWGYDSAEEKRGDGFELIANAGLRLLHTYDVQFLLNFAYTFTFNDYKDEAFLFTIGVVK